MEPDGKSYESCSKVVTKRPFIADNAPLDMLSRCATMISAASLRRMFIDNFINFQCHEGKETS